MDKRFIWVLTIYEYNTFSYLGIKENDYFIHATESGAADHANRLNLAVCNECENPDTQCTIDRHQVLD